MASLTNEQINQTYESLIKTVDNTEIDGTAKGLTDGNGNALPVEVSTTDINFTGNADFTNATVTGLPDNNTTYDLGAVGAAGNINIALSGSDATNDVVTMQAGTNITLTDNGSNTFTIDAAGGGGGGSNPAFSIQRTVMVGPSASDQIGASVLIPANSFAGGDLLEISGVVIKNNPAGWQYLQFRVSPNNTGVFDGVQMGGDQSPDTGATQPLYIQKKFAVNTENSRTYGQTETSMYDSINRQVIIDANIDWTVDQYLTFVYFIDDAAASCTIHNLTIRKIN